MLKLLLFLGACTGLRYRLIPHLVMVGLYLLELVVYGFHQLPNLVLHAIYLSFVLFFSLREVLAVKVLKLF